MKKKKIIMFLMAMSLTLPMASCGISKDDFEDEEVGRCDVECTCTCEGCACSKYNTDEEIGETEELYSEKSSVQETEDGQKEVIEEVIETETQIQSESDSTSAEVIENQVLMLSDAEKAARKQKQAELVQTRQVLYSMENSKDKTIQINQIDKKILENNAYDFSSKNVVFIGDSITEGITSAIDQNGNYISYVTYANSYLHFGRVLNHGLGGRMFSTYADESLSLAMNFGNVTNIDSDIIVVFAGVNDFLSSPVDKRFGDIYNKESTAGYCGSVRYFMKQLKQYYGNKEIFFVTMYNVDKNVQRQYSDVEGQPTLNDYLEVQRKLAKEYGFNIIELHNIGFMDCTNAESSDYFLRDGLHPKDNGSIFLGEHIAAELSLYFGQKYN